MTNPTPTDPTPPQDVVTPDIKATLQELGATMQDIRDTNEKALKAMTERNGEMPSELTERFEKMDENFDKHCGLLEKMQKEVQQRHVASEIVYQNKDARFMANAFNSRHCLGHIPGTKALSVEEYIQFDKINRRLNWYQGTREEALAKLSSDERDFLNSTIYQFQFEESTDSKGGHVLPEPQAMMIDEEIRINNPMRQHARAMKISQQEIEILYAYDGSNMSGWVAEGAAITETDTALFSPLKIKPHKQFALWLMTEEIEIDPVLDLEAWFGGFLGRILAEEEAKAFIKGTGDTNNQPTGLLTATTTTTAEGQTLDSAPHTFHVIKTGANGNFVADTATEKGKAANKLIEIVNSLKSGYRMNAKWFCNRPTLSRLMQVTDPQGNYIIVPDFRTGFNMMLLGHQVVTMDFFPDYTTTDAFALTFGDMGKAYCIVDRTGYSHLRDPYSLLSRIRHYVRKRVGGKPVEGAAMRFIQFGV